MSNCTEKKTYAYGLNDRARDQDTNKPVGLQLPSNSRSAAKTARPRATSVPIANTADATFEQIYNHGQNI